MCIRDRAPRAFINSDLDALAVLSCVACKFPMVAEPEEDVFSIIKTGDWVKVDAVSYTHLDVYKRQAQRQFYVIESGFFHLPDITGRRALTDFHVKRPLFV